MIRFRSVPFAVALGLVCLAPATYAHRLWLVASTTVLSGTGHYISVEGAISNDLFFPNHLSLPLATTSAIAPSGKKLELLSPAEGKIRSCFELKLDEAGTYRVATISEMMFLNWKEGGETKYDRGTPSEMEKREISGLAESQVSHWVSRVETIVTCGKPTPLKPTAQGLEFDFVTHPNDLFHGEAAKFRVLLDGKPRPDTKVTIVRGDNRFQDQAKELVVTSDSEGLITISWPSPGRYWLTMETEQTPGEFRGKPLERGTAYFLTLDVLPQ